MTIPLYQVDAFTRQLFAGNPAAVVPLPRWLPDGVMQRIAAEINLSETAFCVPEGDGYGLRWFTPVTEVKLCGHATLATAWVLFNRLGFQGDCLRFATLSGELRVSRLTDGRLELDFPSQPLHGQLAPEHHEPLARALGCTPQTLLAGEDLLVELASEAELRALTPDFAALLQLPARGIIVTARGQAVDFVSRFFAPRVGIDEDPVTGSAHTKLTPFWARKLGKSLLQARQLSARTGELECELSGDRVLLRGHAVPFSAGQLSLPDDLLHD